MTWLATTRCRANIRVIHTSTPPACRQLEDGFDLNFPAALNMVCGVRCDHPPFKGVYRPTSSKFFLGTANMSNPYASDESYNPFQAPQDGFDVASEAGAPVQYAGFLTRFAAAFVDGILLAIVNFPLGMVIGSTMGPTVEAQVVAQISGVIIGWLYAALLESSDMQGTLGKKLCGIKVVDLDGRRVSFGRATGRHFGKILSGLILLIGYIMAAFTEKKQALHDMMAGCLVVKR